MGSTRSGEAGKDTSEAESDEGQLAGNPAGVGRRPGRSAPDVTPDGPVVPPREAPRPSPSASAPDAPAEPGEPGEPGNGDGDGDGDGGSSASAGDRPTRPTSPGRDHGHRPQHDTDRPSGSGDSGDSGSAGHQGREGRDGPATSRPSHRQHGGKDGGKGGKDGRGDRRGDGDAPSSARKDKPKHDDDAHDPARPHDRKHGRDVEPATPGRPSGPPATGRPAPLPHSSDQAVGKHDLYEPDLPFPSREGEELPQQGVAAEPSGEVLPVLPLGAGMALIGLGLAFLGLRLRRG